MTTDGAYRNGLSIISASDLLVEDCVFARTGVVRDLVTGTVQARYGTQPRAGVDIEPDAAHDLLANVTLRRVSAIENAGDAFDVLACKGSAAECFNRPGQKVSVALEQCEAKDCPYIWGSAFVIALNSAAGSVTVTNCSAANMPGAGLAVYASTPFGGGTALMVHNLSMHSVATEWQRRLTGKCAVQSWYPITIGAQGMMPNHINLNQISVNGVTAVAAGQTFVGCQNHSYDDNYFVPASCGPPGRVSALTGDVTVRTTKNQSACSKALLSGAGDNLAVTCSTLLASDMHVQASLKTDDHADITHIQHLRRFNAGSATSGIVLRRTCSVRSTEFGAAGDNLTDDSAAFAKAILDRSCGRIVVEPGACGFVTFSQSPA